MFECVSEVADISLQVPTSFILIYQWTEANGIFLQCFKSDKILGFALVVARGVEVHASRWAGSSSHLSLCSSFCTATLYWSWEPGHHMMGHEVSLSRLLS